MSFSNFEVCDTVLLTIITMLCTRLLERIHLLTADVCPFTNICPTPTTQPLETSILLCFYVFDFLLFIWSISGIPICILSPLRPSRPVPVFILPVERAYLDLYMHMVCVRVYVCMCVCIWLVPIWTPACKGEQNIQTSIFELIQGQPARVLVGRGNNRGFFILFTFPIIKSNSQVKMQNRQK